MKTMKFWAVKLTNGQIITTIHQGKISDKKIDEAYANDLIADVIESIEAKDLKQAVKIAKKEFEKDV